MNADPDDALRAAQKDMEQTAREMEHLGEEVDEDIERSHERADALRERQGDAAEDVAGDWHETDDAAGGEDPSGVG